MDSFSAFQLAGLSGLGGLLLAGAFLLTIPIHARFEDSGWLLRFGFIFVPLLGGAALNFIADDRLRKGVKENRWPDAEIAPLRGWLESPPARVAGWSFLLLGLAALFLFNRLYSNLGWAALILSQTLSRLQTTARPPLRPIDRERVRIDWRNLPVIRSEHWGER